MSSDLAYPIHKNIQYSNNAEYRQCLRNLFGMVENPNVDHTLDEISKDELNYDESSTEKWMAWISEQTKDCYELNELYKLAAATMISLDRETGVAVLFSFDYFVDFHQLLIIFFKTPGRDLEMFAPYERLWNRLSRKP